MNNLVVPFNDLTRIHNPILEKITNEIEVMSKKSSFILGDYVEEFENNFSQFTGSKYTIGCANGTDALEIVLRALNIGHKDEVIVPANTFIATALAISRCGATPVFLDNDEYYLLDTSNIQSVISKNTKAIIGVNLYGQLGHNKVLKRISKENKIHFIEDSAQSHGALQNNEPSGKHSIAATYSFYPGKNLGAWGDGGCITTNNKQLADKIRFLRNWGSTKKYIHNKKGFNSRLDPIQAIVLNEKLKKLKGWNAQRNQIAEFYLENLDKKYHLPFPMNLNYHVWHLFVIRVSNRKKIIEIGKKNFIEFGIHYPKPIHRQKAFQDSKQFLTKIKNADKFSSKLLSLPIFPDMKLEEMKKVVGFFNKL